MDSNVQFQRKGFGKILDLRDETLNNLPKPKQKHGTFLKFSFLDLNSVKEDDQDYWNVAVRDEQNTPVRIEAMQQSYITYGWLYSEFPPCVGTDGRPRDGRTRILAAKKSGERWIIVAIFSYDETSSPVTSYISDSIACQQRPASTGVAMNDIVAAGLACIDAGECEPEKSAIENLVYNELEAEKFFSNISGNITKIINQIINALDEDGGVGGTTVRRSRDEWIEWLEKSGYPQGTYILLSVDNPTYAMRAWCQHLLPFFTKKKGKASIILYTNAKTGERARHLIGLFSNDLTYFYSSSFAMVNRAQSAVEVKVADPAPFIIEGAIPQIMDEHDINGRRLIKIDEY
jgi:hypothetical protein